MDRPRGTTCLNCKEDIRITGIISSGAYSNQALQRGIEWLKFKGVRPVAEILGGLIIPQLKHIAPIDELSKHAILVPIPLHKNKLRKREFNQSEDIARAIGTMCTIEMLPLLIRTKHTKSQVKISHKDRPNNMRDAFALTISQKEYANLISTKPIIILIDDVSTTGSTLMSASQVFPKSDEIKIWCAVVARG